VDTWGEGSSGCVVGGAVIYLGGPLLLLSGLDDQSAIGQWRLAMFFFFVQAEWVTGEEVGDGRKVVDDCAGRLFFEVGLKVPEHLDACCDSHDVALGLVHITLGAVQEEGSHLFCHFRACNVLAQRLGDDVIELR
jgi:hypothetical protein